MVPGISALEPSVETERFVCGAVGTGAVWYQVIEEARTASLSLFALILSISELIIQHVFKPD